MSARGWPELALPAGLDASICLRDGGSGQVLASHTPHRVLRTASVGKIFLLAEAARLIEAGHLDPAELLDRSGERGSGVGGGYVADSGLWWRLGTDRLPVADVATLIGAVSDNLATNVLLERIGVPAVAALAQRVGCTDSRLLDKVREHRDAHHPPTLSRGRADEWSAVLVALGRRELVSPGVSDRVAGWLGLNTDLSMVASVFNLDPLAHTEPDRGIGLVNKTGTISTVRAEVGFVSGPGGSLGYAVLLSWDDTTDRRDPALAVMHSIGQAIRDRVG